MGGPLASLPSSRVEEDEDMAELSLREDPGVRGHRRSSARREEGRPIAREVEPLALPGRLTSILSLYTDRELTEAIMQLLEAG